MGDSLVAEQGSPKPLAGVRFFVAQHEGTEAVGAGISGVSNDARAWFP